MRLESIVSSAALSLVVSGCAMDVAAPGNQNPQGTDQVISGAESPDPRRQVGDMFWVDLSANSADGTCVANADPGGRCNLRGALAAAPRANSPVTIVLSVDSTIDFDEIVLEAPAKHCGYEITIRVPIGDDPKAITGFGTSRFIRVPEGVTLNLNDVVITGFAAGDEGGAILNRGTVTLNNMTLFDNRTVCEGTGGLQAVALCGGGAVANYGSLLVTGGTRLEGNRVLSKATTAAFPTATAVGGAIVSYGNLVIDGAAVFTLNFLMADASPGVHPMTGTATAIALGGAVYNSGGTMLVKGSNQSCSFVTNNAWAQPSGGLNCGDVVANSRGGAIASIGGMLQIGTGACEMTNNGADQDPDVYYAP